jgi:hypothetical protein
MPAARLTEKLILISKLGKLRPHLPAVAKVGGIFVKARELTENGRSLRALSLGEGEKGGRGKIAAAGVGFLNVVHWTNPSCTY